MPQLVMHIDFIGRQKQRDVLLLEFHNRETGFMLDYTTNSSRKTILDWFDANGIPYSPCGSYASETRLDSYRGQIYIDVPFDETDPLFRKAQEFLEHSDGTMKFEGAWFCYLPLDVCMENAHHDVPGFWEDLMAKF